MIFLKLVNDRLVVYKFDGNEYELFSPCQPGLMRFLKRYKLDVESKVTEKRLCRLLMEDGRPSLAEKLGYKEGEAAIDRDDMKEINKLLGKNLYACKKIYRELQGRIINPSGSFGNSGRFYAANGNLISCRRPSRAYPYSEMNACRTFKYVKKCFLFFGCKNEAELRMVV